MAAKRRRQTLSSENDILDLYDNVELIKQNKLDCQDQKVFFFFFVTDKVRNFITSYTQQFNALTAEMKAVITFFLAGKLEKCSNAPVMTL